MPETASAPAMPAVISRTIAAIAAALGRRDSRLVLVVGTVGYLLVYLFTVGDLALTGDGFSLLVVRDPLGRMFSSIGFFSFEPIARVEAPGLTYLFSPLDAALSLLLAGLVGLNLALTYLGLVQPKACGLESSSGVFAAVPALISGAACCGPTILLVIGVQATGTLITGFQLLVPAAILLLVGSLVMVGRQVDPALL